MMKSNVLGFRCQLSRPIAEQQDCVPLTALSHTVSLFLEGAIETHVLVSNNSGLVLLLAGVPHSKQVIRQCGRFVWEITAVKALVDILGNTVHPNQPFALHHLNSSLLVTTNIFIYVTLEHKTSLKCRFFEIEIYASAES